MTNWHLVTFVFALLIGVGRGSSESLTANDTNTLERRQCVWNVVKQDWDCNENLPSLNQIVARMHDTSDDGQATEQNRAVFFTGLHDFNDPQAEFKAKLWIHGWLTARGITGYYTDGGSLNRNWFKKQQEWILQNEAVFVPKDGPNVEEVRGIFIGCYCQALAVAAVHEEEVFFAPHDFTPRPNSVWAAAEFWPLTQEGGPVKKIWRADPCPPELGGPPRDQPVLMWERGRDKVVPPVWKCPITVDG